jgi:hypothetical protein
MLRPGLGLLLASARGIRPRLPRIYLPSHTRIAPMATVNTFAERFFADKAAPLCSLEVSKAFSQLRYVSGMLVRHMSQ